MDAKDHAILFLNWQRNHGHPLKDGIYLTKMIHTVQRETMEACARIAKKVYGDAVQALGTDEPQAVGNKISKAISAMLPKESS